MITRLSIQGFRGINRSLDLQFARVTLLTGRNGLGKTTVFDAIDWCLFGRSWRLGDEGGIRNLYDAVASPKVSLTLSLERDYVIERDEFGVRIDGELANDRAVIERFVRDPEVFGPYARDVEARVRRLVYLPQAEIRDLVKPAAESERVALLHNLLGVPNASVVEKSVRRVRERLAQREGDILTRLEAVRGDIADVRTRGDGIYDRGGLDRESEMRRARDVLGPEAAAIESADGLLAVGRAALEALGRRKAQLSELRAWFAEAIQRRIALEAVVSSARQAIASREAALREQGNFLSDAVERRDRARAMTSAAREVLSSVGAQLDRTRRLTARLRTLEEVEASSATVAAEIATADLELLGARDAAETAERAVENQRLELMTSEERLAAWRAKDARIREFRDLDRQSEAVKLELDGVRREKSALDHRLQVTEGELLRLNQTKQEMESRYLDLISKMPSGERLAALLTEVAGALTQLGLAACPLCGATYHDSGELLQHVQETANRRGRDVDAVHKLSEEVSNLDERISHAESERLVTRRSHTDLGRKEEELARNLRRLGARLMELQPIDDNVTHDQEGEELGAAIKRHARSIEDHNSRISALRTDLSRRRLQVERLRADLLVRQAQAVDIRTEFEGRDPSETRVVLPSKIQELESQQTRAATAVSAAEDAEREADLEAAEHERHRHLTERELVEFRSRETGDLHRLTTLDGEIATRARDAGIENHESVVDTVRGLVEEVESREANVRRVVLGMDSLIRVQQQEERRAELKALEAREREIAGQVDELIRAKVRFDAISVAIQARAEEEARNALVHQTGAIQECVIALLPHRHLNRVVWDETTGSILVSDRMLASAVRPDVYTSTGQMNILALAVFLGVALLQRITRLNFLALDEPVQNLDDVHFLAFVTMVKRIAGSRQMILSTADRNFAELFRRQMKSTWEAREYAQYEWESFEAGIGPDVVKVESRALGAARASERTA